MLFRSIISWIGDSEEWVVEIGDLSLISTEPILWIRGLDPNVEYEVKVYSKDGEKLSEPLIATVKTEELSNEPYKIPHLAEMKEEFNVNDILPVIWKDLENPELEMTYHLGKGTGEHSNKVFSFLPESITFNEKGVFTLIIKFGDEWQVSYKIEVK